MIEVPAAFARAKVAGEGEAGRAWVAALPGLVEDLLRRWGCTPDGCVMHGAVGIVVPVCCGGLPPAVIKVSFPHGGNRSEPEAYVAWNGCGAVRLFERDDERCAMLLERASDRTLASVTKAEEAVTIQGMLSARLAVQAPPGLARLSDEADRWIEEMHSTAAVFGYPLSRRVVDAAVATVRELGHDQPETLVHGDLHDANILASEREPWLAIDPKCCVGDPAHEALNVIRSPRYESLLRGPDPKSEVLRLLGIYCGAAGIDFERTRRWMQVGAVREALWGRGHGDPSWLVDATDRLAMALT